MVNFVGGNNSKKSSKGNVELLPLLQPGFHSLYQPSFPLLLYFLAEFCALVWLSSVSDAFQWTKQQSFMHDR
ncbi:hypothetical protein SRHO_G00166550 [Serrasalmus rhombeus]